MNPKRHLSGLRQLGSLVRPLKSFVIQACLFNFVHPDAKLASVLTNILEGDLARQVDIFNEQEGKEKRYARGRQILMMIHKHFSTNIKHGAIYDFEDLLSVQLINEDLKNFMTR